MAGGGSAEKEVDVGLLGFLGVSVQDRQAVRRFVLWRENECAVDQFIDIGLTQKQWVIRGMEGDVFALDGNYLLSYLGLYFKKKQVKKLVKDIQWVAYGYLNPKGEVL